VDVGWESPPAVTDEVEIDAVEAVVDVADDGGWGSRPDADGEGETEITEGATEITSIEEIQDLDGSSLPRLESGGWDEPGPGWALGTPEAAVSESGEGSVEEHGSSEGGEGA